MSNNKERPKAVITFRLSECNPQDEIQSVCKDFTLPSQNVSTTRVINRKTEIPKVEATSRISRFTKITHQNMKTIKPTICYSKKSGMKPWSLPPIPSAAKHNKDISSKTHTLAKY